MSLHRSVTPAISEFEYSESAYHTRSYDPKGYVNTKYPRGLKFKLSCGQECDLYKIRAREIWPNLSIFLEKWYE